MVQNSWLSFCSSSSDLFNFPPFRCYVLVFATASEFEQFCGYEYEQSISPLFAFWNLIQTWRRLLIGWYFEYKMSFRSLEVSRDVCHCQVESK